MFPYRDTTYYPYHLPPADASDEQAPEHIPSIPEQPAPLALPSKPTPPKAPRSRLKWLLGLGAGVIAGLATPAESLLKVVSGGTLGLASVQAVQVIEKKRYHQHRKQWHIDLQQHQQVILPSIEKENRLRLKTWQKDKEAAEAQLEARKRRIKVAPLSRPGHPTITAADFIDKTGGSRNPAEKVFAEALLLALKREGIEVFHGPSVPSADDIKYCYTPDLTVFDRISDLWLDVEIDEPWYRKRQQKLPNHYLGLKRQDKRDRWFVYKANWGVLRLSLAQAKQIDSAIATVVQVLNVYRAAAARIEVMGEPHATDKRWTKESALSVER